MKLRVEVLDEHGVEYALLGLSLNKKQPLGKMPSVAHNLAPKDKGHNKFLESILVWLDVTAPRFWWQEFDTYRVGVTKQSESTMHTILKDGDLTQEHFDAPLPETTLRHLNWCIKYEKDVVIIKQQLPEGFLQRRIICTNYKALRGIYAQRRGHRLPHWKFFLARVIGQLVSPEYITS